MPVLCRCLTRCCVHGTHSGAGVSLHFLAESYDGHKIFCSEDPHLEPPSERLLSHHAVLLGC